MKPQENKYFKLRDEYYDWANLNPSNNHWAMLAIYFTILHFCEDLETIDCKKS